MSVGEILILGSGTSTGVPVLGCHCAVCLSPNLKNRRTRASIAVRSHTTTIVVDTSVDFRLQALSNGIDSLDAVLYTHSHADHLHGLDDVRPLCHAAGPEFILPCYGYPETLKDVESRFAYVFEEDAYYHNKPAIRLTPFPGESFLVGDIPVQVIPVVHGRTRVAAFKFWGSVLYATDLNQIPGESAPAFENLDLLILGAPLLTLHPTHFSVPEALEWLRFFRPRRGLLTHLSHAVEHESFGQSIPEAHLSLAYDGQQLAF